MQQFQCCHKLRAQAFVLEMGQEIFHLKAPVIKNVASHEVGGTSQSYSGKAFLIIAKHVKDSVLAASVSFQTSCIKFLLGLLAC